MRRDWLDLVQREGTLAAPVSPAPAGPDEAPACPACGVAAPLVDGACSDCGLQLG